MSDDAKDRFGDTIRKKEKAEEDRYFAEQDRAKLERLRKSESPGPLGLCPRCGIPLAPAKDQHIQIDRCPKCGGVWLDANELEAVCRHADESWASRWLRSLLPTEPRR